MGRSEDEDLELGLKYSPLFRWGGVGRATGGMAGDFPLVRLPPSTGENGGVSVS